MTKDTPKELLMLIAEIKAHTVIGYWDKCGDSPMLVAKDKENADAARRAIIKFKETQSD